MTKTAIDDDNFEEFTDADFLSDVEFSSQQETDLLLACIADFPDETRAADIPPLAVVEPEWLSDVRELARKHGPFSTARIVKIVPILMIGPVTADYKR